MDERLVRRSAPFPLYDVVLGDASAPQLAQLSERMGLALSVDEMRRIQEHFRRIGRDPTDIELQSLGQAWSEHCCYKSSKVVLKEFIFPVQAPYVIDRGDAGVVEFDEDHAYALRIESHNHPSAIEPYGGANTGIGGILRDVLAMGAQPIALADPLHFGPLDYPLEKLSKGMRHPKYLFGGVVAGIRDYGNRVGIPTVAGCIVFDEGYLGNVVVNVACVGFAKKSQLVRNRATSVRDVFILAGGKTGRDGIHGVTYASGDLTDRAVREWETGAVQLGDPILKEPLIHACIESAQASLLAGLKDLGGGGLSCVVGEMALAGGFGAEVDLERVPLKEEGLAPWEIWVSESQERMMLAVLPENVEEVRASTVIKPMQGVIGKAAHGDASVIRPLIDSWRALAIATASTSHITSIDPFAGGATAVDEVCRNLAAVGARPHALTNCLNFGNPEKPDRLWSFREAVRGIGSTAKALGLPIPSGNVSFYNESALGPCPPTPVVLGVGIVDDLRRCVTSDFKEAGDPIVLVGTTRAELGGSEYLRLRKAEGGAVPAVDPSSLRVCRDHPRSAIDNGTVAACHDLSHGGLAIAAAEMCLGGDRGADFKTTAMDPMRWDVQLFSESNGRWLVEVRKDRYEEFGHLMEGIPATYLGTTGGTSLHLGKGRQWTSLAIPAMRKAWTETIPKQVVVA